jgi:hypothetical protein
MKAQLVRLAKGTATAQQKKAVPTKTTRTRGDSAPARLQVAKS